MDIAEFLTARYDERERMAKDRLCIVCGHPVKERYVTGLYGIREWRGYEHDERRDSTGRMHRWQGLRCEGGMTGAEPVQRPDLVLADLAVKRSIIEDYLILSANAQVERAAGDEVKAAAYELAAKCLHMVLRRFAQAFADHADFLPEWRIDA